MNFLLGLIQAFLNWLVNILWKKSVDISSVSKGLFTLYAKLVGFVFVLGFAVLWMINYEIFLDWKVVLLITTVISLWLGTAFIKQWLLKYNKVSTLLPFDNLAPLFTILLGYFLFHKASFESFLISILAVVLVILFNIDWENFTLPKKVWLLFLQQGMLAVSTILIAYALKDYNNASVAAVDVVVSVLLLILFTIKISELKQIHKQSVDFYKYRFWAGFAWRTAYIISLFLISNLWVVLSTLLTFLTLWITLILWYFYLDDKPSKKDIILAVLITILVWLGMYFK